MNRRASVRGPGTDADLPPSVVARIVLEPDALSAAVAAWARHLEQRGQGRTADAYRQVLTRAASERGWTRLRDLTYDAVLGYIGERAESGAWMRTTCNRNLTAFRSFTRWLVRSGRLPSDPLALAERFRDDGGPGARAATTEEARAILLHAWARERADRRCRGDRSLYWACLLLHGCRLGEPAQWRWRHLLLDEQHPVVLWDAGIQKAARRQECAIAPELADLLRAHRERQLVLAGEAPTVKRVLAGGAVRHEPISPADPEALVFPFSPTKGSFRADRDRAGVPERDARGRSLTAHSLRKWFATTLARGGVHSRLIDDLMRHATSTPGRYFDPPASEQAAALAVLPRLWPGSYPQRVHPEGGRLDAAARGGQDRRVESPCATHSNISAPPRPRPTTGGSTLSDGGVAGGSETLPSGADGREELDRPRAVTGPGMAIPDPITDRASIDDRLARIDALLRQGARHGHDRTERGAGGSG
ncbi:MAG: hypothetical protein AMXMBFR77_26700 [Phycisphaerales bacterium]